MVLLAASACLGALLLSHDDARSAEWEVRRAQALYAAQAGVEDYVRTLSLMRSSSRLDNPFIWYDG
jgi:hypothetical protein